MQQHQSPQRLKIGAMILKAVVETFGTRSRSEETDNFPAGIYIYIHILSEPDNKVTMTNHIATLYTTQKYIYIFYIIWHIE